WAFAATISVKRPDRTAGGGAAQFGTRRTSSSTRPEAFSSGTPRTRAMVGATSMFSTAVILVLALIPAPEATKMAFIFGSVERNPWSIGCLKHQFQSGLEGCRRVRASPTVVSDLNPDSPRSREFQPVKLGNLAVLRSTIARTCLHEDAPSVTANRVSSET